MITRERMQEIDKNAIEKVGIPSIVLMENAAIHFTYQLNPIEDHYIILASVGNNGGDGLAIGRQLLNQNKKVKILIIGNLEKATTDFMINYHILKKLGHIPLWITEVLEIEKHLEDGDIIIDAIFGIGLKGEVREPYQEIIKKINASNKKIISVDIPSGLDANTGSPLGICVKAHQTITMYAIKQGLIKGSEWVGKVSIASIGIPMQE